MKEYEMLTRASLRSDPTVTLLLCDSSSCMAWSRPNLGSN